MKGTIVTGKDIGLVLIVVMIFGTNFVAMKWGLAELPPLLFVALRFVIVLVPLIFIVPPPINKWYKVAGVGLFINTLQFGFLFIALRADITAGLASLLLQMQVPLTLILSFLMLSERISRVQFVGITVALGGFAIFIAQAGGNATLYGVGMVFLSALSWACGNLILKTSRQSNPLHLVVWSALVPPIPLFILSYYTETRDPIGVIMDMSWLAWFSVAYVAYLSSLVGYTLWSSLMARYSAIEVTPFALLIPIVGLISGAVVLDESLTYLEIIATSVVLAGLALCVLGPRWRRKRRAK